jgi:subtilisin family serine protease
MFPVVSVRSASTPAGRVPSLSPSWRPALASAALAMFTACPASAQSLSDVLPPPPPGFPGAPMNAPAQRQPPPVDTGEGVTPLPRSTVKVGEATYAADQIIVRFKGERTAPEVNSVFSSEKLTLLYTSRKGADKWRGSCLLAVPQGESVERLAERLRRHPWVAGVELVGIATPGSLTPTDSYYVSGSQWSLPKIGMPDAWGRTLGEPTFAIAILDTGIASWHTDLTPKFGRYPDNSIIAFNRVNPGTFPEDFDGHGTFVAGIAAAQTSFTGSPGSGLGIAGVSPNAPIITVKVSEAIAYNSLVAAGLLDAISIGNTRIINLSLEGGGYSQSVDDALRQATNNNVLVVSITGNSIPGEPYPNTYPGRFWRVMAVGATDINDNLAPYSVTGSQISVVAPGGTINNATYPTAPQVPLLSTSLVAPYYSTFVRSNAAGFGTSFAAPHVAGVAHLILSLVMDLG